MAKDWKCDICGRELFRKTQSHGYCLCDKHYHQLRKHGKFLDKNPRTIADRNEFHINGDVTTIDLYNKKCEKIAEAIIDTEDLEKVRYTKWKLSASGYAQNTPKYSGSSKHMHREILGVNEMVDHINGNRLDNRKCNLRVCNKSTNGMNKPCKGYSVRKDGKFQARIKKNQKLFDLGSYIYEDEARWARWYAETVLFGEFQYDKTEPEILESRKPDIKQYVDKKVQRL